jgi:large subunit ribosomal protein L4
MTVPEAKVYNVQGESVGEVHLNEKVFGAGVRPDVMSDVARALMASKRQGTASTKTRGDASGSGAKPWRQKGTGRARAGCRRSPIWRGGGIVFGPHPRDYSHRVPKKVRRLALKSALSAKVDAGELTVLDELKCAEPRTKSIARVLETLPVGEGKVLIVLAEPDRNVVLSGRNIPRLTIVLADNVNALDLLAVDHVVILKEAVTRLESRLS